MRLRTVLASIAVATAVSLVALTAGTALAAGTLTADYRFLKTRTTSAGTAVALTDLKGWPSSSPCATITHPANKFAKETVTGPGGRKVPVLTFPEHNGLELTPTTGLVGNGNYTIAMLFRLAESGTWRRLIEFDKGGADTGLYISPGDLLYVWNAGTHGTTPIGANQWVQVVVTRDGTTNQVNGYLDGNPEFSYTDSSNLMLITSKNTLHFFQDACDGTFNEDSAGAVARIRLYDGPLTATQVASLDRLPKKQSISLSPNSGAPGTMTTVTGSNFGPGETVTLTFVDAVSGSSSLGAATTAVDGSFTTIVTIPGGASAGTATISARGDTSTLVAKKPFTVT